MKNFTALFLLIVLSQAGIAQKIVTRINAPAFIAGTKVFAGSDFGADLGSGLWTADAVLADPLLACQDLNNASAIAGKIAVIERGVCFFDEKCLKAQEAGAIAVVIMNHGDLSNRGGPPYTLFVRYPDIAAKVTIPCVMVGYEDNLALKAAFAANVTVNITLGALPRQDNDLAIYTNVLPSYNETYVFNPSWGCIPKRELKDDGDFVFQPGAFFRNDSPAKVDNINVRVVVKKEGSNEYENTTSDNVSLEPDSIAGLLNDPYDLRSAGTGQRDISYTVLNDKSDPIESDNHYRTYFYISDSLMCKCRINPNQKAPIANQYWGGGSNYREILSPFRLRHGKGAFIDSLFTAVASNESLAGMYLEGRIYKFTDLNGDGDIQNDELETVAVGSYTFPNSATGNFGTIRMGLDDLVGDPNDPYFVEEDNTLFFASVLYPGGSNSFFIGYDVEFTQRQYFNYKDGLMELDITDWPYISSNAQDVVTGGPVLENAGLFYVDANGDGIAQTEEIAFFSPTIAFEIHYPAEVGTRDLGDALNGSLRISPVPAHDNIHINFEMEKAGKVRYQIFDAKGKPVLRHEETYPGKEINTQLNIAALPAGNYILQVRTEAGSVERSFSKLNR